MSVIEKTKERVEIPVDLRAHVVGFEAAVNYVEFGWGMTLDETDLEIFKDIVKGPTIYRMVDDEPVYAMRALDVWTIVEYGDHDGSLTEISTMVWCLLKGGDGPDGYYAPTFCEETGKVDVIWTETPPLTAEEVAGIAKERDAADQILPE